MKIFQSYRPLQIAKYVKGFFKGRIYIHGRGSYEFCLGHLVMAPGSGILHKRTVSEVNGLIDQL
ncbi:DUF1107 family protein [Dongshaea marina]|uniref:DUF1107 family protein n=1 Tax=Dongshaea marina TaxID=2047966 RepID=UPI000D3E1C70|nr:DUF1107 family protein [Dongshaea marina]